MQLIIVILILAAATSYAFWRIYQAWHRQSGDPCAGCSGCALKDRTRCASASCPSCH